MNRVRRRDLDEEVVAVFDSSTYLSRNGSDALLWFELAQGTTRDALLERLAQAYLIEGGRAEEDVDRFLAEVRGQGPLEEE